jgi:CBS domain-containing protein
MTVSDLMREDVVTAKPDEQVRRIARRMRDETVGSVVVEEDGRPIGIITDRDLTTRILAEGADPDSKTARDIMTSDPETVTSDAGVRELCDRMSEARVRRMPVIDYEGNLAGIITHDDLNTLLADEQRELAEVVQAESPPY